LAITVSDVLSDTQARYPIAPGSTLRDYAQSTLPDRAASTLHII